MILLAHPSMKEQLEKELCSNGLNIQVVYDNNCEPGKVFSIEKEIDNVVMLGEKNKLLVKQGDLFEQRADVVMHQCNCFCVWGKGVALKMKDVFPEAFEADKITMPNKWKGGGFSYAEIKRENPMGVKYVCNLYGQINYGYGRQPTDYNLLQSALEKALAFLDGEFNRQCSIAIPYMIGCGLGRGSVDTVVEIINNEIGKYNNKFTVTAYKL